MEKERIEVKTPLGTIIAYPSADPENPGVYVDFVRPSDGAHISMANIECQLGASAGPKFVAHVWGDGNQEDSTHDIGYENMPPV